MEHLPQTKGKGVLMFAQRRQRMDEISAEQEELRSKGLPIDAVEPHVEHKLFQRDEITPKVHVPNQPFRKEASQRTENGLNGLDSFQGLTVSKHLVPNRTAKPFLGAHTQGQKTFSPVRSISSPTSKKPENIFKVPVPVNTNPQVWSPTSDIIASRDERIAIPAIKTGILPETKRRGVAKTDMSLPQQKGLQKGLPESGPEEDFLSLGAEACNFMQAPKIKQKNPPPVLPKPVINPAHPPWSTEGPSSSIPLAASSYFPDLLQTTIQPFPQPKLSKPQPPGKARLSSQSGQQQVMAPRIPSPGVEKHQDVSSQEGCFPAKAWIKPTDGTSVASCPPQQSSKKVYASLQPPSASHKKPSSEAGASKSLNLKGKGAKLFARRQTRMEKFVVDDESIRASKTRSPSPSRSMPSTWKYTPNVRAPPPLSYNPIHSPFFPLAAVKQPPSTSPKTKSKSNKETKARPTTKHLNVLDVMKHQPYQLDPSLFAYNATQENKEAVLSEKSMQTSTQASSQIQNPSTFPSPKSSQLGKTTQQVNVSYPFTRQPKFSTDQQSDGKPLANASAIPSLQMTPDNISKRVLPVAPRPKFSAKKASTDLKQWKPVVLQH